MANMVVELFGNVVANGHGMPVAKLTGNGIAIPANATTEGHSAAFADNRLVRVQCDSEFRMLIGVDAVCAAATGSRFYGRITHNALVEKGERISIYNPTAAAISVEYTLYKNVGDA